MSSERKIQSLVTEEEMRAIKIVTNAMDNLVEVHNEMLKKSIDTVADANPYQLMQYLFFSDMIGEAVKSITALKGIDLITEDVIDGMASQHNKSVEEVLTEILFSKMTHFLKRI